MPFPDIGILAAISSIESERKKGMGENMGVVDPGGIVDSGSVPSSEAELDDEAGYSGRVGSCIPGV